jgi:hypothetical protein
MMTELSEEYESVVETLHDAILAIDLPAERKINALINVAIEAAFAIHGPAKGRELLIIMLMSGLKSAAAQGVGEPGYLEERH